MRNQRSPLITPKTELGKSILFQGKREEDFDDDEGEIKFTTFFNTAGYRSLIVSSLEDDIMILEGVVGRTMAQLVSEGLLFIQSKDPRHPHPNIDVRITSPGGNILHALAIHDRFLDYAFDPRFETQANVRGYVIGHAFSAASQIILQGCTERLSSENATIMCHNIGVELREAITRKKFLDKDWHEKIDKDFLRWEEKILTILTDRTGKTEDEVRALLDKEEDITADEALKLDRKSVV